jgi:hypothetical protein
MPVTDKKRLDQRSFIMPANLDLISGKWAVWASNLKYDMIPAEAVKEAKRYLLDSIGCALADTSSTT